jgi:hypothetical protein
MKASVLSAALALALGLSAGPGAAAPDPSGSRGAEFPTAQNGLLPVPANRIVGLWRATVTVGPCAGGPVQTFTGTNLFHAGGTVSDTNTAPVNSRGPGMGVWRYLGGDRYKVRFQFNRYADNLFVGTADVRSDARLRDGGNRLTYETRATQYAADGSVLVELCGSSESHRIGVDD